MGSGFDIDVNLLVKHWVHSHEEDEGSRMVFHPPEFPFPRARALRQAIRLHGDGELQMEGRLGGADDRGSRDPGRWSLKGRQLTVKSPGFSGVFDIEAVDEHRLVLRRR